MVAAGRCSHIGETWHKSANTIFRRHRAVVFVATYQIDMDHITRESVTRIAVKPKFGEVNECGARGIALVASLRR